MGKLAAKLGLVQMAALARSAGFVHGDCSSSQSKRRFVLSVYSADETGGETQGSDRPVGFGSRIAAEMLAALLVVHLVFLIFISQESPVLFNVIILLHGSLPAELHETLAIVGGSIIDGPSATVERLAIGLAYAVIWLGLVIWLSRRGGWLVPILVLAVAGWEVYWRVRVLQLAPEGFLLRQSPVLFGLLCAGVAALAGLIGLVSAVRRYR
ncbi:MAG: hypothetical protein AAF414_04660 [Pseudomonadota bacterium]